MEICDDLHTSIKYSKEEFFYVVASAFACPMVFGVTADRAADPSPDLSHEEQSIVNHLSENFVKWTNPEEVMLGMVGISSYWNKLGKKPVESLVGQ